jgi:site-specific DNA recombinase
MRKVIALFDEYQSKENAKHVIRSMKENARQGFWNGATPPLGYRLIEAEKRGAKIRSRRKRYGSCSSCTFLGTAVRARLV